VVTPVANTGAQQVQFVLVAPSAKSVALVGDFNDWDAATTPLVRSAAGVWSGTVTLAPGRHLYAFVVDGTRWVADPAAPQALGDDFGTPNSVITVGGSATAENCNCFSPPCGRAADFRRGTQISPVTVQSHSRRSARSFGRRAERSACPASIRGPAPQGG